MATDPHWTAEDQVEGRGPVMAILLAVIAVVIILGIALVVAQ